MKENPIQVPFFFLGKKKERIYIINTPEKFRHRNSNRDVSKPSDDFIPNLSPNLGSAVFCTVLLSVICKVKVTVILPGLHTYSL